MYNKQLNDEWTNKLRGYCLNKRVLIVGNALSLFANEYGDYIDSFDVVVRLGKGYVIPEFTKHLGSKTDVWQLSILRATTYKEFQHVPFKILNLTQISLYDKNKDTMSIPKIMLNGELQVYKDFFLIGSQRETLKLIYTAYQKKLSRNTRISQGALATSYFLNMIKTQRELHLIGFDFFESKIQYKLHGELNEVGSYHLPIPLYKGANKNPHTELYSNDNLDKQYILRLAEQQQLTFHKMENIELSKETQQLILDKYRPKGELV